MSRANSEAKNQKCSARENYRTKSSRTDNKAKNSSKARESK